MCGLLNAALPKGAGKEVKRHMQSMAWSIANSEASPSELMAFVLSGWMGVWVLFGICGKLFWKQKPTISTRNTPATLSETFTLFYGILR
jgi:hypothetical protein